MDRFEQCIAEGNIVEIKINPEKISRELKEAEFDLESSEHSEAKNNFKWTSIQAHYSLMHSFNALLNSKGYRANGYLCQISGINKFYVGEGLINEEYLKDFEYSHKIYEGGDNPYNHKEDFAIHILSSAGDILEIAQNILGFED
ncbi:MAG: HEPN domain-containing protein [Nitrospirae bacterium]|nr:HEPN domain-containing protein [Nitrospirota bacterium]